MDLDSIFQPLGCQMGLTNPIRFEYFSRGHFIANKFQNDIKVKLNNLAIIFNSLFDHKYTVLGTNKG